MILALILLLGLCFGSLATLLAHRLPLEEPVGMTRSRCVAEGRDLTARELVPVLSWVFQRGKCHGCGAKIHWRYPLIELATAALFAQAYLARGLEWPLVPVLVLALALVVLTVTDFEHRIIPDEMQWTMFGAALLYHWLLGSSMARVFAGGTMGLGVGLLLHYGFYFIRKRHGLGLGDVKLLGVAGCWIGGYALVPFFVMSGLLGIVLGVAWRIVTRDPVYPFGPALGLALWLLVLYPPLSDGFWILMTRTLTP